MEEKTKRSSLFWPVFLIALGLFLFLNQIGVFNGNMGGFLLKLWPLLFIVGGLDGLYKREGYTGALVSIGIGTVFLLANLGYFQTSAFQLLLRLSALRVSTQASRHTPPAANPATTSLG